MVRLDIINLGKLLFEGRGRRQHEATSFRADLRARASFSKRHSKRCCSLYVTASDLFRPLPKTARLLRPRAHAFPSNGKVSRWAPSRPHKGCVCFFKDSRHAASRYPFMSPFDAVGG